MGDGREAMNAKQATSVWTSGDRIGKLSSAQLRTLTVDVLRGRVIDQATVVHLLEALDAILDAVAASENVDETDPVVEEVPDLIKGFDETIERKKETAQEEIAVFEKQTTEAREQTKDVENDRDDIAKRLDEMTRRAELAEHHLETARRAIVAKDVLLAGGLGVPRKFKKRRRRVESTE